MGSFIDLCRLADEHRNRTGEWPREARLDARRFHGLAHDLSAEDFGRVSAHLQLRVRQTPGASVGGRAVVQLEDLRPEATGDLDAFVTWLGMNAVPHPADRLTLDQAFYPRSESWGLRGDAPLWEAMRVKLFRVPIPQSEVEISEAFYDAANEIVGADLRRADDHIGVRELAIGHGMSDGFVSPEFWRDQGMPELVRRAVALGERVW